MDATNPYPLNNLDPSSKPWARRIEEELTYLRSQVTQGAGILRSNNSGTTGALARISDQVSALADQAAATAAVVNDLNIQVARIDALVNATVEGQVANAETITTFTTSWADYLPVSIAVPSGYSRAQVFVAVNVSIPVYETVLFTPKVNGVEGPTGYVFGGQGSGTFAYSVSGLGAGATVEIRTRAINGMTSSSNRGISCSASIIFMR